MVINHNVKKIDFCPDENRKNEIYKLWIYPMLQGHSLKKYFSLFTGIQLF